MSNLCTISIENSLHLLQIQPQSLTNSDLQKLAASGISRDTAKANHLFRADSWQAKQLLGIRDEGDFSGIIIPYQDIKGSPNVRYALRLDHPALIRKSNGELKEDGKYRREPGTNRLFLPWIVAPNELQIIEKTLIFVEGEKKAVALQAWCDGHKMDAVVVAVAGVWNWRGKVGKARDEDGQIFDIKGELPELNQIEFSGRKTIILFDANVRVNASVRAARLALSRYLHHQRKADVFWAEVPDLPGVNGIDDLIGLHPDQVQAAIESPIPYIPAPQGSRPATVAEWQAAKRDFIESNEMDRDSSPEPSITPENISKPFLEVILRALAEAGFSDEAARAVFAIVSRLDGNQRQSMPYASLYPLLAKCGDTIPKDLTSSQRRIVRNYIQELEAAQKKSGIVLFLIDPGFQKNDGTLQMTMVDPGPLFELVARIDAMATEQSGYQRNKSKARMAVMAEALAQTFDSYIRPEVKKKKNPAREAATDAKRTASAIVGFFKRAASRGISLESMLDSLAELIPDEVAPLISALAQRLEATALFEGELEDTPNEMPQNCTLSLKEEGTFFSPNPGPELAHLIESDKSGHESFAAKKGIPLEEKPLDFNRPEVEKNVPDKSLQPAEERELASAKNCSTRSKSALSELPQNPTNSAETEEFRHTYKMLVDFACAAGDNLKEELKSIGGLPFYFKVKGILESLAGDGFEANLRKIEAPPGKNTRALFEDMLSVVAHLEKDHQKMAVAM